MIFNFIWQGKPPKIKRMTIVGEKNKGRLKMIDFEVMNTMLKIVWIKRICQNSGSWKTLIEHFFKEHSGLSFFLNCRYDVKLLNLNNVPPPSVARKQIHTRQYTQAKRNYLEQ